MTILSQFFQFSLQRKGDSIQSERGKANPFGCCLEPRTGLWLSVPSLIRFCIYFPNYSIPPISSIYIYIIVRLEKSCLHLRKILRTKCRNIFIVVYSDIHNNKHCIYLTFSDSKISWIFCVVESIMQVQKCLGLINMYKLQQLIRGYLI